MSSVGYVIASAGSGDLAEAAAMSVHRWNPGAPVIIVEDYKRRGYAATLNRGIAAIRKVNPNLAAELNVNPSVDIFCCLNADVLMVESDALIVERFDADPDLAVIGPRQLTSQDFESARIAHGGIIPYDDGTEWDLNLRHRTWNQPLNFLTDELSAITCLVPTVAGSVLYVRGSDLDSVGGWPEATRFYYEDTWLCYRLRSLGRRVLYEGLVTWVHYGEQGSDLSPKERAKRMKAAEKWFKARCVADGIPLVDNA